MSFLNLEIDLCEQILAENDEAIPLYPVFDPDPLPVPSNAIQLPSKKPPRNPSSSREASCSGGGGAARPQGIALARGRLSRQGSVSAGSDGRGQARDHAHPARGCSGIRDHARRGQGARPPSECRAAGGSPWRSSTRPA